MTLQRATDRVWRIMGAVTALAAVALTADAASVTLTDKGTSVLLDNGEVTLEVGKSNGELVQFTYHGTPLLSQPAYLDWVSNANHHLSQARCRVVTDPASNGGSLAEISLEQAAGGRGSPFAVELHFVLRRDDPGCYVFAVFHHPKTEGAATIAQSRWVLRVNEAVFDFINVDDQRRRVMPKADTPVKPLGPKESLQFTAGPWKGEITDKYHWFVDAGDHFVHGWSGTTSHLGLWLVDGSREDENGGPTKQHNTAHFGALLLKILTCSHYGAHDVAVAAGEEWNKLYGPWMLYVNTAPDPDAMWADAKAKAAAARREWPYAWMHHPLYPTAAERGEVRGRIVLRDPSGPVALGTAAWVGLAARTPDWQQQANNYQFWVHPAADGSFVIPHVRAGTYTLYAFTPGVLDEFRRDDVAVGTGATVELGRMDWRPPHDGRTLWQIGLPDRSAGEFRHGDAYRQWGLWRAYPADFPHDVDFVVGRSDERFDWNYAQVNVVKDGRWSGTTWQVEFDLPTPPTAGTATLRVALAAAHAAALQLAINGTTIDDWAINTDNAMIRAGIHGQYTLRDVPFPARLLKAGRNRLTLEQRTGKNAQPNVMYDCLRLELDDARPFDSRTDRPRIVIGGSSSDGIER